jgi:nondiscriminating glutamyl-tRNA synthetase
MTNQNHTQVFKTRFAPSPTGLMHFGNLRAALFNYLFSRSNNGVFLLRIEDTDQARSEDIYCEAIQSDLHWLGIEWQEGPYYQSERGSDYDAYYKSLEEAALVYPCFCSEEQLELTRKLQLASGQAPRYPGTCRHLSEQALKAKQEAGSPFALRFKVPKGEVIEFEDQVKGLQRFEADHIGDFIIRRTDTTAPFMFCNAIDDSVMGVTHALRGDDHLTNTPRQILILKALKLRIPQYGHFPTILGPDSRPLSKRNGSRSIQELREEGYIPLAILNYLSRLGHHIIDTTLFSVEELSKKFNLANISNSPAHYDAHQLNFWQKEAMHHCSTQECWGYIGPYAGKWVPSDKIEAFVAAIQPNIIMPKEAEFWAEAIFSEAEEITFSEEIKVVIKEAGSEFFIAASELLKEEYSDSQQWIATLQQKTGKKGKGLFFPLRAAITSVLHGPELARVLELIGIEKTRHRFLRAARHAAHL